MFCNDCGEEMKFEGTQEFPTLGYGFPLYTCVNPECENYGSTHGGEKFDLTPDVMLDVDGDLLDAMDYPYPRRSQNSL
jgi:hypothetical protein